MRFCPIFNKMDNKKSRIFSIALLSIYGIVLAWIILFKVLPISEFKYLRAERSVNWIPFHYDTEVNSHLREVLENVLVFIPFGVYLGMLNINAWKTILLGLALSMAFEILQYVFAIGAADVTDLIANTAGAAVGAGIYLVLKRIAGSTGKLNLILNIAACVGTVLFILSAVYLLAANR